MIVLMSYPGGGGAVLIHQQKKGWCGEISTQKVVLVKLFSYIHMLKSTGFTGITGSVT